MPASGEHPPRPLFKPTDHGLHGSTRIKTVFHLCSSVKSVVKPFGSFIRLRLRRAQSSVVQRLEILFFQQDFHPSKDSPADDADSRGCSGNIRVYPRHPRKIGRLPFGCGSAALEHRLSDFGVKYPSQQRRRRLQRAALRRPPIIRLASDAFRGRRSNSVGQRCGQRPPRFPLSPRPWHRCTFLLPSGSRRTKVTLPSTFQVTPAQPMCLSGLTPRVSPPA